MIRWLRNECVFIAAATLASLCGCVSSPAEVASNTTVFVVRHAEKMAAGRDPGLTDVGRARAALLAERCVETGVAGVYSTPYQRTFQTAEPAASRLGLEVNSSFAPGNEEGMAAHIIEAHAGSAALVVAHSNTVPRVIAGLGAGSIPDLPESSYDRLFVVTVTEDGSASFAEERYGKPTP